LEYALHELAICRHVFDFVFRDLVHHTVVLDLFVFFEDWQLDCAEDYGQHVDEFFQELNFLLDVWYRYL
jgi:hypothetical protein